MRKLEYTINLNHFREIKNKIVPVIFTQHQFNLIEKKLTKKKMTASERNEFSRTVSKKMKAIHQIMGKKDFFVYGENNIRKDRLKLALGYLKKFSRKFKNKQVLISGSFLYQKEYNDIDIFVVSKYEKEDYHIKNFHINYLTEDVYSSLFFASLKKLCLSNEKIKITEIREKIDLDIFISLYQELFNDLDRNFKGVKKTLREFLLQAAFISHSLLPDSLYLTQQVNLILKTKKPKEIIKKIFVNSVVLGTSPKKAIAVMKNIISSYQDIIKEYKQHKSYYLSLTEAFKEVISIES